MYNLVIAHLEEELAENARPGLQQAASIQDDAHIGRAEHYRGAQITQFEAAIRLLQAQSNG